MVKSRNAVAFVNIHPQKSKWVTAKIILVSPASILVGEWLQRQRHIGAWPLYILFKCDVRHHLHCFVCTDTHLFNFTKGKTDLVNQRWRRTTCLQHQCYDVGCYPCPVRCFLLTVPRRYFFCGSFLLFVFPVCHVFLAVVALWSLAGKWLTSCLSCVWCFTFPCGVLGQVVFDCVNFWSLPSFHRLEHFCHNKIHFFKQTVYRPFKIQIYTLLFHDFQSVTRTSST